MKKAIFTILLKMLFQQLAPAQTQVVTKFILPQKTGISFLKQTTTLSPQVKLPECTLQPVIPSPFLYCNGEPLIKSAASKPISVFAEFAFNDMLENSLNKLKTRLINSYDDQVSELFKDAPSVVKVRCIITF